MDFILDPGLVLYLPFYELDGSSFISKDAYGHLATVTGALWTPQGRDFDPVDDTILTTFPGSLLTTQMTIDMWIKPASSFTSAKEILGQTTGDGYGLGGGWTANKWGLYINLLVEGWVYSGGTTTGTDAGIWHHMTGTYDVAGGSNNIKVYVDGVLEAQATGTHNINATGYHQVSVATVARIVGEGSIYNRALTAAEIQRNYLATKWRYR